MNDVGASSFWGYPLVVERGNAAPRGINTDWWVHCFADRTQDEVLFSLHVAMHRPWPAFDTDDARERHVRATALSLARGFIQTGSYTHGDRVERRLAGMGADLVERDDQTVEIELLRAYHRMSRRQVGTAQILSLDVEGFAHALEVAANQVRALIGDLVRLGEVESYGASLGQGAEDGASRLTGVGIRRLREEDRATIQRASTRAANDWSSARTRLSTMLDAVGLAEYLATIERNLEENTTSGNRSTLYACRSLLDALATLLWRDPRPTYTKLPGSGPDGHLSVTSDHWVNRLGAFINERVEGGRTGKLMSRELERIWTSIDALSDLASMGHDVEVSREDAEYAAATTYLLAAELGRRTGLAPIESY